jgi:hypothetical protein
MSPRPLFPRHPLNPLSNPLFNNSCRSQPLQSLSNQGTPALPSLTSTKFPRTSETSSRSECAERSLLPPATLATKNKTKKKKKNNRTPSEFGKDFFPFLAFSFSFFFFSSFEELSVVAETRKKRK